MFHYFDSDLEVAVRRSRQFVNCIISDVPVLMKKLCVPRGKEALLGQAADLALKVVLALDHNGPI
ncbi:hypothetical protein D3C87_1780880 [compost metagenome]